MEAARVAHAQGTAVLIVTARSTRYRHHTGMWLALHGVPSDAMWMRAARDMRPDYEVKRGILAAIRRRYRPVHAWDDNPSVLRLWAEEGIPATTVPGWDDPVARATEADVPRDALTRGRTALGRAGGGAEATTGDR